MSKDICSFKIGQPVRINQLWFDFGVGIVKEIKPQEDLEELAKVPV